MGLGTRRGLPESAAEASGEDGAYRGAKRVVGGGGRRVRDRSRLLAASSSLGQRREET